MKKNMSNFDRGLRVVVALVVAVLYFAGQISGTVAIILGILAAVFILTSLVGTCPLYLPFGLSTKKNG
jgi:K+-transporting ATPase A subunit